MGLKMNGFGLMYNDANTSSLGKDFEVNIATSNAGGKFHNIKCTFCGRINKISLQQIKDKLEYDSKVFKASLKDSRVSEEDKYMDNIKGSMCSFRCGNCNMPVSTTISHKEMDIYETLEYHKEVQKVVDNIQQKGYKGITKEQYLADRKKD